MNNEIVYFPEEIHDITIIKIDKDKFKIAFGTKTDIPGFYSARYGIDVDRKLLQRFLQKISKALED